MVTGLFRGWGAPNRVAADKVKSSSPMFGKIGGLRGTGVPFCGLLVPLIK